MHEDVPPRMRADVAALFAGKEYCNENEVSRPVSGHELRRFVAGGAGRLEIDNGTSSDAVAQLVNIATNLPYRTIYIRKGERGVFTRVSNGHFTLRFQFGERFRDSKGFCMTAGTKEFDNALVFSERREGNSLFYSSISVTLYPVAAGTAETHEIPDEAIDFSSE